MGSSLTKCCGINEDAPESNIEQKQAMAKNDYYLKNGKNTNNPTSHSSLTTNNKTSNTVTDKNINLNTSISIDGWSSGYDDDVVPTQKTMKSLEKHEDEMLAEMKNLQSMHSSSLTPVPANYNITGQ